VIEVSIIIPTYNRASILDRALRSVLTQKGVSFETIVVDDGSTDGTKDLVQSVIAGSEATKQSLSPEIASPLHKNMTGLAMTNIRYLYQSNRGPSAARNLGISHARGKFIAFLDSDDEWMPGKLVAQLHYFEENPDSLICQTEEIWIRNGRRVNPMKKHKKYGGWIFEKCLLLSIVSPSAVMMRREFFDRVGLFDESLPACEDYDLWLRASCRMPIGLIEKPYVIKYGGHLPAGEAGADQQSRCFPVLDRFRIRSIRNLLASGVLNESQKEAALQELKCKCEIVARGALKRGLAPFGV